MSPFSNLKKLLPGKPKGKHGGDPQDGEVASSLSPWMSTTKSYEQVMPSITQSTSSVQHPATTHSKVLPPVSPASKSSGSQSIASDTIPSTSLSLDRLGPQVLFHVTTKDVSGVDIVFVHGLRGSSLGTWSKGVVCWPRDLLKIDIQDASYDARIITWGYDSSTANVFSYASKGSIFGHAETLLEDLSKLRAGKTRPIIFLGHSLGGLVIKQALIKSAGYNSHGRHPTLGEIYASTKGVIFLGTPHRGSDKEGLGEVVSKVAKFSFRQPNEQLLQTLRPDSHILENQRDQFTTISKDLPIVCIREELPTAIGMIVSELSANIDGFHVRRDAINANHMDMVRFDNRRDVGYQKICGHILILIGEAVESKRKQTPSTLIKPVFSVPFGRDKQFVGREDILSQVEEQLQIRHRVSLHGLGGIGKSQVAIEYAHRFRNSNPKAHVFWVYAASVGRFDQSYKDVARKLKLPRVDDPDVDVCELVSDWFNDDDNGHWLIILDNADNSDLFFPPTDFDTPFTQINMTKRPLVDYLPRRLDSQHSLIVTTRSRTLGEDLTNGEPCIEIPTFTPQEARILLQSRATRMVDGRDESDVKRLLEILGYIPLAITQATAFMRRNRMHLQKYLEALEKDEENLKDHLSTELRDHRRELGIPNSVFRTWRLSFDMIREQEPRAAAILSLMAMLDRQQIPEKLLRRRDERDVDFSTAIGSLEGLSLITREVQQDKFTMHRLVQLSVHVWLEQQREKLSQADNALVLLADRFPNGEHENWETCESFLPHAQAVLQHQFMSQSSVIHRAILLYNISWFDWRQGRYDLAHKKSLEAYQINLERLGREDRQTLNSLALAALVLQSQGKYGEAERVNRRVLEGREEALGAEHPDTLASMADLASTFWNQGRWKEAEELGVQVMETRKRVLGEEHPDTLTSMANLASTFLNQGRWKEAEELGVQVMETSARVLGEEHPDTLTSMANLASTFLNQGRWKEAEELEVQVMETSARVLGEEHPDTLTNMANLAFTLKSQGRNKEAILLLERCFRLRKQVLSPQHPHTTSSLEVLNKWQLENTETGV
ncbi:MAG: hypothetical protein M1839_008353 [Geoglossum umbratile]|nr:MAG: hypothetical protein M1839_008353 [Geoglossum umbratile]